MIIHCMFNFLQNVHVVNAEILATRIAQAQVVYMDSVDVILTDAWHVRMAFMVPNVNLHAPTVKLVTILRHIC